MQLAFYRTDALHGHVWTRGVKVKDLLMLNELKNKKYMTQL